ncbi:MAG: nucleoside triphosphate pyrophosphatase [Pseudomonadota bacterium]|nr:nucleoside triphosphate pyrophosphatase [Pseudomonadota bacterium]
MNADLILASASPRRLNLLSQIGINPSKVVAASINEMPIIGEKPAELVKRLAISKSLTVAKKYPKFWILGADTTVACGRRILGKPSNEKEARLFLKLLSGRRHRVYGGICLISPDGQKRTRLVSTAVVFKRLDRDEIDTYIELGEWKGMAGAYAIQGAAAALVPKIIGSYSNVVGLALAETASLIRGSGFRSD